MTLIEYFENRAVQVLSSADFDEGKEYFSFFLGAYDFVKKADLFANDQEKEQLKDIFDQLVIFMEDLHSGL